LTPIGRVELIRRRRQVAEVAHYVTFLNHHRRRRNVGDVIPIGYK
jgi:hypothetical protein